MVLLCEDREHERFFRPLCRRWFGTNPHVIIAPSGKGSAAAWVQKQYPTEAAALGAKPYGERVALVVVIDGDNVGVQGRKRELEALLPRPVEQGRRVAICVPTWSVETWLLCLCTEDEEDRRRAKLQEGSGVHTVPGARAMLGQARGRRAAEEPCALLTAFPGRCPRPAQTMA